MVEIRMPAPGPFARFTVVNIILAFCFPWLSTGEISFPPPPVEQAPPRNGNLTARPEDAAAIVSPAPGSDLPGATVTCSWSSGAGVAGYYLMVGEWAGGNTLFDGNLGTQRSATVQDLPVDGRMIYVRLWSLLDGEWEWRDAQFRAAGFQTPSRAEITLPAPNSVLGGASVKVEWSAGVGVRRYYLFAGLWPGGNTLFSQDMELARSAVVSGLPVNGQTIYLRLWSLIGEEWVSFDGIYRASGSPGESAKAQLTSPAPGSALSGTSATFTWSAGVGATQYYFFAGLWQGGDTLASIDAGESRSVSVATLPDAGETIWIRIWSRIQDEWQYNDYQLKAYDANPGAPSAAELVSPAPGSTLTGGSAVFQWAARKGALKYFLFIGNWVGDNSIASVDANLALSASISNLPVDGRLLFVRLWTYLNGEWTPRDYQVRAFRQ